MKICALCGVAADSSESTCLACGHADWFDVPEPQLEEVVIEPKRKRGAPTAPPPDAKPAKSVPPLNFRF